MVRDHRVKARNLGIRLEDYEAGDRKLCEMIAKHRGRTTEQEFVNDVSALPHDEMVAVIRWDRLDLSYPSVFDWNGLRETA